jgi:hypothetical protein
VERLELTGGPSEEEKFRIATTVYNDGSEALAHAYDIVRNKEYRIGKQFSFLPAYKWLVIHTQNLMAGEEGDNLRDDVEGDQENRECEADAEAGNRISSGPNSLRRKAPLDRREGPKSAKKRRRIAGAQGDRKSSDDLNRSIAENISNIVEMIEANDAADGKVAENRSILRRKECISKGSE